MMTRLIVFSLLADDFEMYGGGKKNKSLNLSNKKSRSEVVYFLKKIIDTEHSSISRDILLCSVSIQ